MYHIKNDKRTELTSGLISNALNELILNNNCPNLTVTQLVKKAGVGRATFYRSFDSLEDVLRYQIDSVMKELFHTIHNKLSHLEFFYEYDLYTMFFHFWNENDAILKVLLMSNKKSLFSASFNSLYNNNLKFIQPLLDIQDSHWSYFVILRSAVFTDGLFEWIQRGKKESSEEISKILLLSFSELHMVKMSLKKS